MKYLKTINEYGPLTPNDGFEWVTDPDQIHEIMSQLIHGDATYTIRDDGTIDVDGSVLHFHRFPIKSGRLPVKFGIVNGNFSLSSTPHLITTLEGCPEECHDFSCLNLSIKNLIGGPKIVRGDFDASGSRLESLQGAPEEVGGYFDISDTSVSSLVGGPKKVGGYYDCSFTNINDLIGAPEEVGEVLFVNEVDLTSLEGVPKRLRQLEINTSVATIWDPRPLKDVECEVIRGKYDPIITLLELFKKDKQSSTERTEIFLDSLDYNYVRGTKEKPLINLFRLKEALTEFGIGIPFWLRSDGTIPRYTFVDDRERKVDFWGNLI